MAPWGNLDTPAAANTDLYPEVDLVTEVLKKMDVRPDFTYQTQSACKSLRYIHRTADGIDIYFVANKLPQHEQALCSFRVSGKRPELWWPETGRTERPLLYKEADGVVRVPIAFNSSESVFVIFREPAKSKSEGFVSVEREGKELFGTAWKTDAAGVNENALPQPVEESGVKLTSAPRTNLTLK